MMRSLLILAAVVRPPFINIVRRRVLRRDEREPDRILVLYVPDHGKPCHGKPTTTYQKRVWSLLFSRCRSEQVADDHMTKWAKNEEEWRKRIVPFFLVVNE